MLLLIILMKKKRKLSSTFTQSHFGTAGCRHNKITAYLLVPFIQLLLQAVKYIYILIYCVTFKGCWPLLKLLATGRVSSRGLNNRDPVIFGNFQKRLLCTTPVFWLALEVITQPNVTKGNINIVFYLWMTFQISVISFIFHFSSTFWKTGFTTRKI